MLEKQPIPKAVEVGVGPMELARVTVPGFRKRVKLCCDVGYGSMTMQDLGFRVDDSLGIRFTVQV